VRAFFEFRRPCAGEKPIATALDRSRALIALAEETGRVLTVGHQERFVLRPHRASQFPDAPKEVSCWRMGRGPPRRRRQRRARPDDSTTST